MSEMERKIVSTARLVKQMEKEGWRKVEQFPYGWLMERPKKQTTKAEGETR